MERHIQVTGRGMMKVSPDTIRLMMEVEGLEPDYAKAVEAAAAASDGMKSLLETFGFRRSDLKTLNLSVDSRFESYEDKKDKTRRQRFVGYAYRHNMKLEFPLDQKRLGQILYALSRYEDCPEISVSYTVADPEAQRNTLLDRAVLDAKEKADVLARAAGASLGSVFSIDYSWGEIDFEVRPYGRTFNRSEVMYDAMPSMAMDIDPDDIEMQETVTCVWELL